MVNRLRNLSSNKPIAVPEFGTTYELSYGLSRSAAWMDDFFNTSHHLKLRMLQQFNQDSNAVWGSSSAPNLDEYRNLVRNSSWLVHGDSNNPSIISDEDFTGYAVTEDVTSNPVSSPIPGSSATSSSQGLNAGLIAGIVIAVTVIVIGLFVGAYFWIYYKNGSNYTAANKGHLGNSTPPKPPRKLPKPSIPGNKLSPRISKRSQMPEEQPDIW
jgi:hypothetical protein